MNRWADTILRATADWWRMYTWTCKLCARGVTHNTCEYGLVLVGPPVPLSTTNGS